VYSSWDGCEYGLPGAPASSAACVQAAAPEQALRLGTRPGTGWMPTWSCWRWCRTSRTSACCARWSASAAPTAAGPAARSWRTRARSTLCCCRSGAPLGRRRCAAPGAVAPEALRRLHPWRGHPGAGEAGRAAAAVRAGLSSVPKCPAAWRVRSPWLMAGTQRTPLAAPRRAASAPARARQAAAGLPRPGV